MRLYEFPPTRSIRVRWTLQELGVPFDAVFVDMMKGEHRGPEFLKINPAGKLPVLVDGELVLTESIAILLYLAEKYPDKSLAPGGLAARAELYKWLLFTTTELEQPLWRIARHTSLYPKERRLPEEVTLAREDFTAMAAVCNEHMKDRAFVVGDAVTVGDFALAYTLDWANEVKLLEGFPHLQRHLAEMYRRPNAPLRIAEAFARVRAR